MAGLESDKVEKALLGKMQAIRREGKDWKYIIYNDQKKQVPERSFLKALSIHWTLVESVKWPISWVLNPGNLST